MVKCKKYVLLKVYEGDPKRSDFDIVEEELPPLKNNEVLVETEYISVSPYMRIFPKLFNLPLPTDLFGEQVGRIVESKHKGFPVGRRVVAEFGWRTHTIFNPDTVKFEGFGRAPALVPDFGGLPSSLALGVLGMPGNSAYFGFVDVCKPQPGDVVVVTGAAGAVGSLVGQIAKIKGCKVIGLTGSDDKCKWLKEELGYDVAINYRTADIGSALKEAAPDGIDCFFDNVGGESATVITRQLRYGARVCLCGFVSEYSAKDPVKGGCKGTKAIGEENIHLWHRSAGRSIRQCHIAEHILCLVRYQPVSSVNDALIVKEVTVQGFYVYTKKWTDRWDEGLAQILRWIKEGRVKHSERVTEGFDNMYDAFMGMLQGDNSGKAVVKV